MNSSSSCISCTIHGTLRTVLILLLSLLYYHYLCFTIINFALLSLSLLYYHYLCFTIIIFALLLVNTACKQIQTFFMSLSLLSQMIVYSSAWIKSKVYNLFFIFKYSFYYSCCSTVNLPIFDTACSRHPGKVATTSPFH